MDPLKSLVSLALISLTAIGETAPSRTEWMGAYLNRSKVGHSFLAEGAPETFPPQYLLGFDNLENKKEGAARILYSVAELELKAFGTRNRVSWKSVSLLNEDYSLSSFGFYLSSGGAETRMAGDRTENVVELLIGEPGHERRQSLPIPQGPLYVAEALPLALAKRLAEGKSLDGVYNVLEPHQLTVSPWRIDYEGKEIVNTLDGPVECHRIKQDAGGFFPIVWIDIKGSVWKEFAPLGEEVGYYSYRETEEQARDVAYLNPSVLAETEEMAGEREPDLLYATAVDAGTRIARPSRVKKMIVDLWDFEPEASFPFSERQKDLGLETRDRYTEELPLRLEITTLQLEVPRSPFPPGAKIFDKYKEYLSEETFIEAEDPKIIDLAKKVTADSESPWEKALALFQWIQENVETEFRITLPSALEVLESKKGDCNEQSALFAALARAAGVPAKICTGLVYQGGAFYYHAWNEVLVQVDPELWTPIDPALRQKVADATHIKFSEGGLQNQTYINALIGKLKARIRETRAHDPDRAIN